MQVSKSRPIFCTWVFYAAALHVGREVHQPEGLHKLIDINAPVLVEVNALSEVCDGLITDLSL